MKYILSSHDLLRLHDALAERRRPRAEGPEVDMSVVDNFLAALGGTDVAAERMERALRSHYRRVSVLTP